jgi:VWA domain-containing protein
MDYILRYPSTCARFKLLVLNSYAGLVKVRKLIDIRNMLKSQLADAFALLICLCASACPTDAQHSETHVVPVTVLTMDGKPVSNLQPQNVRVHGRDVQVNRFSLDTSPRRIVLLIDISGSMGISNGRVDLLQAAVHTATLFLDRASSVDSISVHLFAEKEREVVPFTSHLGVIRAAIMNLPKPGTEQTKKEYGTRTDLDNALNSILTVLFERPQFGDAIIIFSDGRFPRSGEGDILSYYDQPDYLRGVTSRLGTVGVRVFFSLAGNVAGAPPLHGIELFVGATGGESFELHDSGPSFYGANNPYDWPKAPIYRSDSLEQRALALSAAVQDTYRLLLQFTRPLEKPTRLHLDLVDERGKALHNVVVLSPALVYPEAKTQP